jgi:hypothetical protein
MTILFVFSIWVKSSLITPSSSHQYKWVVQPAKVWLGNTLKHHVQTHAIDAQLAELARLANGTIILALGVNWGTKCTFYGCNWPVVCQLDKVSAAQVSCDLADCHTVVWFKAKFVRICALGLTCLEVLFVLRHDFRFALKNLHQVFQC